MQCCFRNSTSTIHTAQPFMVSHVTLQSRRCRLQHMDRLCQIIRFVALQTWIFMVCPLLLLRRYTSLMICMHAPLFPFAKWCQSCCLQHLSSHSPLQKVPKAAFALRRSWSVSHQRCRVIETSFSTIHPPEPPGSNTAGALGVSQFRCVSPRCMLQGSRRVTCLR